MATVKGRVKEDKPGGTLLRRLAGLRSTVMATLKTVLCIRLFNVRVKKKFQTLKHTKGDKI